MLVEPRQVRIKWDLPCWYWNNIINNLQLIWCKEHNNMAVVFMLDLWKSIDLVFGVYKPGQLHITGVHKTMDPPSTFPGDHAFLHSWNDFSTHGIPMFGVSSHVSSKSNWFFKGLLNGFTAHSDRVGSDPHMKDNILILLFLVSAWGEVDYAPLLEEVEIGWTIWIPMRILIIWGNHIYCMIIVYQCISTIKIILRILYTI